MCRVPSLTQQQQLQHLAPNPPFIFAAASTLPLPQAVDTGKDPPSVVAIILYYITAATALSKLFLLPNLQKTLPAPQSITWCYIKSRKMYKG